MLQQLNGICTDYYCVSIPCSHTCVQCGFTPQYTELEEIYKKYSKDVSVNGCELV